MKILRLAMIAGMLAASATTARAQMLVQADGGGTFGLMPMPGVEGGSPLFAGPNLGMASQGTAGGRAAATNNVDVGFDYIRPYWSSRDFTLVVPAGQAGAFPLLGNTGNVDNQFALAPRVNYKYDVSTIFSVGALGTFLSLTGNLNRNITSGGGGEGDLTANSSLTIITATVPEFSARIFYDEAVDKDSWACCELLQDMVIDVGIGTRYASIVQNYTGVLTNTTAGTAVNSSSRFSTQQFQGIGLTARMDLKLPVKNDWLLFSNLRGSVLVGDNNKNSNINVVVAGVGTSDSIRSSETEFIPVVEWNVGIEWGHELANLTRRDSPASLFTVRVALTTQFWGDVGPLSAGSAQGFQTSNLYLYGANVMAGFHR